MIKPLFASAPAKINLCLHVTGLRPDGYHDLESLVVFAALGDHLQAIPDSHDHLLVEGPFAKFISTDNSNLVLQAVAAFRSRFPDMVKTGVRIKLTKNLPVAAGIGGGSADAAAALRIMAQMSDLPVLPFELMELALDLGSDVPACLHMQPAMMGGIGEKLYPAPALPALHMVLVNPLVSASTREIFAKLIRRENPPMPKLPPRFETPQSLAHWLETTRNDLAGPAYELVPQIKAITGFLKRDEDCLFARMSGSGATVFGLYQTTKNALDGAAELQNRWPEYWVVATSLRPPAQ